MHYHRFDASRTESKRRARRYRRHLRRPRMIPMAGMIPRRSQSREKWKVKALLWRRHPGEAKRGWNGRERSREGLRA
jgi:hypothetical protein